MVWISTGGTLEFDGDYSAVRQTQAYIPSAGSNSSAALEASLELAAHRNLVAVLLPADTRCRVMLGSLLAFTGADDMQTGAGQCSAIRVSATLP